MTSSFFTPPEAGAGLSKNAGAPPAPGPPGGSPGGGAGVPPPAPDGKFRGLNANAFGLNAGEAALILGNAFAVSAAAGGGPSLITGALRVLYDTGRVSAGAAI